MPSGKLLQSSFETTPDPVADDGAAKFLSDRETKSRTALIADISGGSQRAAGRTVYRRVGLGRLAAFAFEQESWLFRTPATPNALKLGS